MVLAIDVGNTNITLGAFKGDKLTFVSRLATDKHRMSDQYACELINIFALHNVDRYAFSGAIISSVVPEITDAIMNSVRCVIGKKPFVVAPGIKTGLNILIDNPGQLGADLLAASVAGVVEYELPCLIVDLGTANKIFVLDENGSLCGGAIAPGISISLNALAANASLLQNVGIQAPKNPIGKNTTESIQSGVVYGTAAMIDGLVERFQEEMIVPIKSIVATGGLAKKIVPNCKCDIIYDENLVLKGLMVIYNKNVK